MKKVLSIISILIGVALNLQAEPGKALVAQDNCGVRNKQPHLKAGSNYKFGAASGIPSSALTNTWGNEVVYVFDGMDIQAEYSLELTFYSAPTDGTRKMKILSDTRELAVVELTPGKLQVKKIDLPKFAFAYGKMRLVFEKIQGSNALVSFIKVYSNNPKKLIVEKGSKEKALASYKEFEIPAPVYAPFPKTTTNVAKPVMSLNGKWAFNPTPAKDFPKTKGDGWKAIQVPSHWATQGFTVEDGTYAGYERTLVVPKDWMGQHKRLRFDSVFSDCIVYINGREVGRHLGTFTAFEFDVTDFLLTGENKLQLKVRNDSLAD
ncbi:MAG: glycoside hydrolase family 2, partial [Lentisphaeria bacterium]|nr:glycoside hydrolase family 2 [Lentisphaeria bacterium]